MNTKIFNTLAAATTLVGVIATAGTASATSLTKTYTANTGDFETTDFTTILSVKKFDPSAGILHKVTLDFFSDITGEGSLTNTSRRSTATPTINLHGVVTLQSKDIPPSIDLQLTPTAQRTFSLAPQTGTTFSGLNASASTSKDFTDANILNFFTGAGSFLDFVFTADAKSLITGSGNTSFNISTFAKGGVTVTYNYKSVPEPSAVIGMGLVAGVGILSSRKKQLLKMSKS